MAEIKNPLIVTGGGGGDVINGVANEYVSDSEDITANTFVKIIADETVTFSSLPALPSYTNDMVYAQKVDEHTAVLFYTTSSSTYAAVAKEKDGTVTIGTSILLFSGLPANRPDNGRAMIGKFADGTVVIASYAGYVYLLTVTEQQTIAIGERLAVPGGTPMSFVALDQVSDDSSQGVVISDNGGFTTITLSSSGALVGTTTSVPLGNTAMTPFILGSDGRSVIGAYMARSSNNFFYYTALTCANDGALTKVQSSYGGEINHVGQYPPLFTSLSKNRAIVTSYNESPLSFAQISTAITATYPSGTESFPYVANTIPLNYGPQSLAYNEGGGIVMPVAERIFLLQTDKSISLCVLDTTGNVVAKKTVLSAIPVGSLYYCAAVVLGDRLLIWPVFTAPSGNVPLVSDSPFIKVAPADDYVDGITTTDITSTKPGTVWLLNSERGGVALDKPRYIVYNCAFRAERRA